MAKHLELPKIFSIFACGNGDAVLSGSENETVKWTQDGDNIKISSDDTTLTFSMDNGKMVATGTENGMEVKINFEKVG